MFQKLFKIHLLMFLIQKIKQKDTINTSSIQQRGDLIQYGAYLWYLYFFVFEAYACFGKVKRKLTGKSTWNNGLGSANWS